MKVGVMQPYFLPYMGYWQLMNAVDKYVVYDDVNYIKRGWINRNRILVNGEPQYINVRISNASQNRLIKDTNIICDPEVSRKTLYTIECAYRKAPFFQSVFPMITDIVCYESTQLVEYLLNSFEIIRDYLEIRSELVLSSHIAKAEDAKGQERILSICTALGADGYYNAIGGQALYSRKAFEEHGIALSFLCTDEIRYHQFGNEFLPNLSILDVMMFNAPDQIRAMLNRFTLL